MYKQTVDFLVSTSYLRLFPWTSHTKEKSQSTFIWISICCFSATYVEKRDHRYKVRSIYIYNVSNVFIYTYVSHTFWNDFLLYFSIFYEREKYNFVLFYRQKFFMFTFRIGEIKYLNCVVSNLEIYYWLWPLFTL